MAPNGRTFHFLPNPPRPTCAVGLRCRFSRLRPRIIERRENRSCTLYHCSVKKFSRTKGQSAPAAAAYRNGKIIYDFRTGEIHDYTRRSGVVVTQMFLPDDHPEWAVDSSQLWSNAELAEKRKNSVVAREVEIALPAELSEQERKDLAFEMTAHLVDEYGVAAEVSIHEPSREGDQRNHHAHIMLSTRRMDKDGFTEKTRELDDKVSGPQQVTAIREKWADMCNLALEKSGHDKRVDHRSLADQRAEALSMAASYTHSLTDSDPELKAEAALYIKRAESLDRAPTVHKGPVVTAKERMAARLAEKLKTMRERFNKIAARFDAKLDEWRRKLARKRRTNITERGRPQKKVEFGKPPSDRSNTPTNKGQSPAERMEALRLEADQKRAEAKEQREKETEAQRKAREEQEREEREARRKRDRGFDFGL